LLTIQAWTNPIGTALLTTFAQLRDRGEDPIAIFEQLFRTALKSLLPDLAKAPWYVREREVVNRGHICELCAGETVEKRKAASGAVNAAVAEALKNVF
jgi:hypothetical protein